MSAALTCAWQRVLHAPVHFVICLLEGEHNIDPVERLPELLVFWTGLSSKLWFKFCKLHCVCWQETADFYSVDKCGFRTSDKLKNSASLLTFVWRIWAVGMFRVTNWLVWCTVKLSVCRTDTLLTVSPPFSWLPRLLKPMCRLKMCSSVSSFLAVHTKIERNLGCFLYF